MFGNPVKQVLFTVCSDSSFQKSIALCGCLNVKNKLPRMWKKTVVP